MYYMSTNYDFSATMLVCLSLCVQLSGANPAQSRMLFIGWLDGIINSLTSTSPLVYARGGVREDGVYHNMRSNEFDEITSILSSISRPGKSHPEYTELHLSTHLHWLVHSLARSHSNLRHHYRHIHSSLCQWMDVMLWNAFYHHHWSRTAVWVITMDTPHAPPGDSLEVNFKSLPVS